MEYLDYRKKLGIGFNAKQQTTYFMTRIHNYLGCIDTCGVYAHAATRQMLFDYCNITGIEFEYVDTTSNFYFEGIIDNLSEEDDFYEFLSRYVVLMNLLREKGEPVAEQLMDLLCENLKAASIQVEIIEDSDGYFVFPKGAKEMDDALVSQTLVWMSQYPKAHNAYVKALKEYSEATSDNASDIADKFRKTLETFLREFFGNNAPLEKNKVEYGRYLKSRGVPAEITGNMETLLQAYANFMNGYAKHQDATSLSVLEYLMYQTGNIIRLLITLKCEEIKN